MGFLHKQLDNVVEWEETDPNVIFHKWDNTEIKKGSKLIIRPGQDAIFYYNGRIEGVFRDEGRFDIESDIIPFLSTLKGFKFGFDSALRAEVLFINTKEFIMQWGTQNPVNIPAPNMPGGMPIRANGTATIKVQDDEELIAKVAGVKNEFTVSDVRERIITLLNPLLMKHISSEGKDMFNLQASAIQIGNGIREDLDMETLKMGITVCSFSVNSFSYPQEVQNMINKNATINMMGDVGKYQQVAMAESMEHGGNSSAGSNAAGMAGSMAGMMMGMQMAKEMVNNMNGNSQAPANGAATGAATGAGPKFCPECGTPTNGAKFCPECGTKLV